MKKFQLSTAFLLSLFFLLSAGILLATPQDKTEYPEEIAKRIQQNYDEMKSLSFNFTQRSKGQLSGRAKTGQGSAYFQKSKAKSRMRWNYAEPDRQVLLSDGKTFKMYFAKLQQMIITPAENLDSDLTYSFFSGKSTLDEQFHILPPDPEYRNDQQAKSLLQTLKLVPREPQSQVQSIHLWISDDSLIRRIEIRDHFDTITQLNLRDIEVNFLAKASTSEKNKLFSFTPPENTEIIRQ